MASNAPTFALSGPDEAAIDLELDSTGAGSPPPSGAFEEQPPHQSAAKAAIVTAGADHFVARPAISARTSLDAALGDVLVISGGSGFNDLVGATPSATYVMPVSDNGGSSSEIIRVLGGPSIGDLRSRLTRLIPTPSRHASSTSVPVVNSPPQSNEAIHNLLSYRLPSSGSSREIKQEWMDILEGRHRLWRGIEPERKEVIRGFLVHFESEVLRRAHRHFNFRGGSIGNFFLAAAQKFFRSIQSAIFLFSATTQISTWSLASKVLPVINTNHTATIAAELEDGEMIVGQCEISHPAPKQKSRGDRGLASSIASGALAAQLSGAPSSAVPDASQGQQHERQRRLMADALQGLGLGDGGLTTPGFGPPAHFHINEPFALSSYTSMNASADAVRPSHPDAEAHNAPPSNLGSGSAVTPARGCAPAGSPLFTQLVDERAAAYASQTRKGLTTVGNLKDGLDPADDDQDSQDGHDAPDSPHSTTEDDLTQSTSSLPSKAKTRSLNLRSEKTGNIIFTRTEDDDSCSASLPSRIRRILYVNAYRNEIYPAPNPSFVTALGRSRTIIYSCGSLWTSIIPCLALRSVATSIAASPELKYKVLLLNSVQDRETRGMDAVDFVGAICRSLNQSDVPSEQEGARADWEPRRLITHVVYFEAGEAQVDTGELERLGIRCVKAESRLRGRNGTPKFDEESVKEALAKIALDKV